MGHFSFKMGICFKESKESNDGFKIIKAVGIGSKDQNDELDYLIQESLELKMIFGSMMKKIQKRNAKFAKDAQGKT